jgi:sterol 3beta-glucosyltransferase
LSNAFIAALQPDLIARAKEIGAKIQTENGAKDCAKVIIDLLEN